MSLDKENKSHTLIENYLELMVGRRIGHESAKSFIAHAQSGFFERYFLGEKILEIGYRGAENLNPILPHVIGIDMDYPGYDGLHLPFPDTSQDAVYSSHCLEHIEDDATAINEWFRVLKIGGYLVITVPHQYLYERKKKYPEECTGHKHFYTPSSLMNLIECALVPNHYRIRGLRDNDLFYDYTITLGHHPVGCYEIELVLQKIRPPAWELE